jgi:hypothetical protein
MADTEEPVADTEEPVADTEEPVTDALAIPDLHHRLPYIKQLMFEDCQIESAFTWAACHLIPLEILIEEAQKSGYMFISTLAHRGHHVMKLCKWYYSS